MLPIFFHVLFQIISLENFLMEYPHQGKGYQVAALLHVQFQHPHFRATHYRERMRAALRAAVV